MFNELLERRRREHAERLGLADWPLVPLEGPDWEARAAELGGSHRFLVEAFVDSRDDALRAAAALARQFPFVRHLKTLPDHPVFPLHWREGRGPWRTWIAVGSTPVENAAFTAAMPARHSLVAPRPERLLDFPLLRSGLEATRLAPETAQVCAENERVVLTGVEAEAALAIEAGRSATDVADRLAGQWPAEAVHFALSRLRLQGLVEEAGARFPVWEEEFWRAAGVERSVAACRLAEAVVAVEGPNELRAAVQRWGLRLAAARSAAPTATLIAAPDYACQDGPLAEANRNAIAAGQPWMLAKITGRVAWIGPAMRPGQTACWECIAWWLRANRPTRFGAGTDEVSVAAAELAVAEFVRWIARGGGWIERSLVTFDTASLAVEVHPVIRRAHCPACGRPPESPPRVEPLQLENGPAVAPPLAETAARLRALVSPMTGLIPEARPVAGAEPFAIWFGRVNGALGSRANEAALRNDSWQALGKARDPLRAEVGCLAESIERHSAGFHPGEPLLWKRWRDWPEGEAIHPGTVVLYSERQHRHREAWNARCGHANQVFGRFDEEGLTAWRPVWSLTCRRARWMAADLCFIDYPCEPPAQFCLGDSNGCAAGNTKAEALLRGLLELIERDAVGIWWYNRVGRPSVAPTVLDAAPDVALGRELLRLRGRNLAVLDLTNDVAVPAAVAVSWREPEGDQVLLGFSADLSMERAASKAVDELCQLLPWPGERIGDRDWAAWWKEARIGAELDWLAPSEKAAAINAPPIPAPSPGAAVVEIERKLAARGLEVLACDLTRPDAGLPVMRAIVPGLRHFHAQFGPGRLYDVPVHLGWLDAPRREEEMNRFLFPL